MRKAMPVLQERTSPGKRWKARNFPTVLRYLHLVYDVWSQIFGILAGFLGDKSTVVIAVEELEVTLLGLDRLQRRLRMGNGNVAAAVAVSCRY